MWVLDSTFATSASNALTLTVAKREAAMASMLLTSFAFIVGCFLIASFYLLSW